MSMTEEIIVTGEDFVERRIVLFPEDGELEALQSRAFGRGYKQGWLRGLIMGVLIVAMGVACIWFVLL